MSYPQCNCRQCRGDDTPNETDDPEEKDFIVWFEYSIKVSALTEHEAAEKAKSELESKLENGLTVDDIKVALVEEQ